MALRKIELRNSNLMLDDALAGIVATAPPKGVHASTVTTAGDGVIALKIRWTVETAPEELLPLEIFKVRLREFYPRGAFIGGRGYEFSHVEPPRGRKLGFPYNTYYKVRVHGQGAYDAALHAKMPIACWQEKTRAFAIVFPKSLAFPQGLAPVFIKASGAEATVDFSAALLRRFKVERKPFGWFGARVRRTEYEVALSEGQSLDASFLLAAADTWEECVQTCLDHLYQAQEHVEQMPVEALAGMLKGAMRFYDRVWDASNRTHVHLPIKNIPRFESVEFKHSHVTDDITKLVLYRRLAQFGCEEVAEREHELREKLASGAYCCEFGESTLWHTTTRFNGSGLEAFTHHGVGFVGFPGGMATVVRRLFEYCSMRADGVLERLAESGAEWLVRIQCEDGSWPALVEKMDERAYVGCVASTAEAARALLAAYSRKENETYRQAAAAAIRFVNREESFFGCSQYLRDVDPDEADGMSAETCIHANLDWHGLARDSGNLASARAWGLYALQWIRPSSPEYCAGPSFDGLSKSITPRIDVWGGLLIARAFVRLSQATGEDFWRGQAWQLFGNIAALRERDGGLCETWFLDYPAGLESIHIEPTFVTDAFVEFILDACQNEGYGDLATALAKEREHREDVSESLKPLSSASSMVEISPDQPECIIDGKLKIKVGFDGAYDVFSRAVQIAYIMLRETRPGRELLKLVPLTKILLNRHHVCQPQLRIGKSSPVEVMGVTVGQGKNGLPIHRYHTPLHEITFSIVSVGADRSGSPAVDMEIGIRTLVGDVRLNQVRIDLLGRYSVGSVKRKEGFSVSSGGSRYSFHILDGSVDAVLQEGEKVSLDVSLCSNWSFFGDYRLRLRIVRHQRE